MMTSTIAVNAKVKAPARKQPKKSCLPHKTRRDALQRIEAILSYHSTSNQQLCWSSSQLARQRTTP